jgi:hypothetical protein
MGIFDDDDDEPSGKKKKEERTYTMKEFETFAKLFGRPKTRKKKKD